MKKNCDFFTTAANVGHDSSNAKLSQYVNFFYVSIISMSASFNIFLGCFEILFPVFLQICHMLLIGIQPHEHN